MTGQRQPNLFEGAKIDMPLMFIEKQVISVSIPSAFLEGGDDQGEVAIPYTYCEVFAPTELMTKVCIDIEVQMLMSSIFMVDYWQFHWNSEGDHHN